MKTTLIVLTLVATLFAGAIAWAVASGGPGQPAPLDSISAPFKNVDYAGLPAPSRFVARDGTRLSYRVYEPEGGAPRGSAVLVHGSSARSESMHLMAQGLARAGYTAYALDVRGHGESGHKGHIAYIGQLEDDLEDFVAAVKPAAKRTLVGFSSGGGFALRFAGDARKTLFDHYLLLSPFVHQDAASYRPASGGWVSVGVPRIVALVALNSLGITRFNDLPVTAFALDARAQQLLTPSYSYALAQNFRPRNDYRADIRAASQPMEVLAGSDDEVFFAEQFAPVFAEAGRPVRVTLVEGIGHMNLTLQAAAIEAVAAAIDRLSADAGKVAAVK